MTGHQNEHLFFNAAKFFPKKKYSTLRINLYGADADARELRECTIRTHADDILEAIKEAKKYHPSVHLVGHSLGGPSIVLALLKKPEGVKSVTLWDSPPTKWIRNKDPKVFVPEPKLNAIVIKWGVESLMGKAMFDEMKTFTPIAELVANNKVPLNVIVADDGVKGGVSRRDYKEYYDYTKGKRAYSIIKGASHCFDEEGVEEELFKKTLAFVKKCL